MNIDNISLKDIIEIETGDKFSKSGLIKCPFHNDNTPSLSVKFYPNINKEIYKCFGCNSSGDVVKFISNLRGKNYNESKEYLGITTNISNDEDSLINKINEYISWEISTFRKGQTLIGIYKFVDTKNKLLYFKGKFLEKESMKKKYSYYHFKDGKVFCSRGTQEVPYNFYNLLKAIDMRKTIVILEGEKDVNTINNLLRTSEYEATSLKGVLNYKDYFYGTKVYVCGDTGEAGNTYKREVYDRLFSIVKEFRFISLPGIQVLGDNKDVSDWIELGNGKEDLLYAFNRSLDLKDKTEIQQDVNGIYKYVFDKRNEIYSKVYLSNFIVIDARRIVFKDDNLEGIKLTLKSDTGEQFERLGAATVFDDVKSFKNFLGTMDLAFTGDLRGLTELKIWINKYFALENEEIHGSEKFIKNKNKLVLLTADGGVSNKDKNLSIKARSRNIENIVDLEEISKEELRLLERYLLNFTNIEKSICIIGTIINNLAVYQARKMNAKLHHLLIIGESGSGKSTILENIIAPILNISKSSIKSIGLTSPFALIKELSQGNYPILLEEFKPSTLDKFKISKLSEIFRNSYDGTIVSRGNKSLETIEFKLDRPIIIVGEESYPHDEKALIERSCIVYLSKNERTSINTEAMEFLINNKDLLRKLGRSLLNIILELDELEYFNMRDLAKSKIIELDNRTLTTAINIHCGIQIFNKLLISNEININENVEKYIVKNIKSEILENGASVLSVVENMLITFNQMLENNRVQFPESIFVKRNKLVYIKTSEMINLLYEYVSRFGVDLKPLKLKDFKKQGKKAGYIVEESIPTQMKQLNGSWKTVRMDIYNIDKLTELKLYEIIN